MPDITIFIADDTTLLRRLVVDQLNREPGFTVVGEAEDGRQAVDGVLALRPAVALIDLDMPVMNGIQAAQRIAEEAPDVRVILFTGHEHLASIGKISGVSAAVLKNCTPEQLNETIRGVFRTARQTRPNAVEAPPDSPSRTFATIARFAEAAALSDKERVVVEKMVTTELTASQIAYEITAESGVRTTESAVKHALERALTKLDIEPRTRAALMRRVLEARTLEQQVGASPVRGGGTNGGEAP